MSARVTTNARASNRGKRRRGVTFLWIAGVAAITIALLVWEQIALLYVLATLAVTVLLIVVARADLSGTRKTTATVPPFDDSAALADNLTTSSAPSASSAMPTATANMSSGVRAKNAKRR